MSKIDGLLTSLMSEYKTHSSLVNSTSGAAASAVTGAIARSDQVMVAVSLAAQRQVEEGQELRREWSQVEGRMRVTGVTRGK